VYGRGLQVVASEKPGGRALVVGLGFIGIHVVEHLIAAGRPPRVLTRSRPGASYPGRGGSLDLVAGDAADAAVVERALDGIDHLVFCAGGLHPEHSEREPELDARLTLGPLQTVLEALRRRPGVALTYLSSGGTVYGEPRQIPTGEEHPTHPIGSYGVLRVACEREIERHRSEHGLQARVLRCATVYGEHQRPDRGQGAVVTFLRRVACDEPIVLYGDGPNARDYVYAGDVARVVVALLDRIDGPAVLNVGSGRGTSLEELVAMIEAQVGRRAKVVRRTARPFDVRRIVLDTRRLRGLVNVEPIRLEAGIERTHRWLAGSHAALGQVV
jgi:UDP-glucose 4-epimerase